MIARPTIFLLFALLLPAMLVADNARETAGRQAKLAGHRFEERVAELLSKRSGVTFAATHSQAKGDVVCELRNLRISLKNPSKSHTQVALLGQGSLCELLKLDANGRDFVTLFFGLADGDPLERDELKDYPIDFSALSARSEIRRNRLLFDSIPKAYGEAFLEALNENRKRPFLEALVAGDAELLGWAFKKDEPESVRYYRTADLVERLAEATWIVAKSRSTLHLVNGERKYLHMQMKGSSKRYSAGYHSAMIHLYDDLFEGLETVDPAGAPVP